MCVYVYMHVCIVPTCTYIFYILATYYTIFSTALLPVHCLYTTYTTRLQIDRHYLCTTCILPDSAYVPLVWMR